MKHITVIGGGSGIRTLLEGLRDFPVDLSVIISCADSGGSSGVLREELHVSPPGDLQKCLQALASPDSKFAPLFSYRFSDGSLKGHTVGNILVAAAEKQTGSIVGAIQLLSRALETRGRVIPVSKTPAIITAHLNDGTTLVGEHTIDVPHKAHAPIATISSTPVEATDEAIDAITSADMMVFGPGDLYTTIIPSLLVRGIKEAIVSCKATLVFPINLMTKQGETDGYRASDFVRILQSYVGKTIDVALVNNAKIPSEVRRYYEKYQCEPVVVDHPEVKKFGTEIVEAPLATLSHKKQDPSDILVRSLLIHDAKTIAKCLYEML